VSATLLIRHPPGYEPERRYICDVIFREFLGLDYDSSSEDRSDVEITVADGSSPSRIVLADTLFQTPADEWLSAASLPSRPLPRLALAATAVEAVTVSDSLPVIYGSPLPDGSFLCEREGEIELGLDVLGSAFFMLSRYEELVSAVRDEYDRFPAAASLAQSEGFLDRPIVNEYLEILRWALSRLWPRLPRAKHEFRLRLSHDVDFPLFRIGREESFRLALRALRREHAPWLATRRLLGSLGLRSRSPERDLYNSFAYIMDADERAGTRSAFNFITAQTAGAIDGSYSVDDPWIRGLLRSLHERGHEIGLHPSYRTFRDGEQTLREFQALRRACEEEDIDQPAFGGRQHYLRWENPITWQNWEDAGLAYDSTLSFADRAGFRCGVCFEYPVFNLRTRRSLKLRESPLIAMDASLLEYQRLSLEQATAQLLELKRRCRLFEGEFTLLWHNDRLLSRRARKAYELTLLG
jgi:hypothetical protein